MKKFEVYNEMKNTWFEVDEDWMENVNTKQAVKFTFIPYPTGEKLMVDYVGSKKVIYTNIHGSWGSPTKMR